MEMADDDLVARDALIERLDALDVGACGRAIRQELHSLKGLAAAFGMAAAATALHGLEEELRVGVSTDRLRQALDTIASQLEQEDDTICAA
jgi:HPt (histidine-containing phosphotransfer) domain-containing protein